jgi:lipopolysaccharide export system protein LptA
LKEQNASNPAKPRALPDGITSTSQDWTYTEKNGDKAVVFVRAKDIQEINNKTELNGVELHIFKKESTDYDLVKSDKASFDVNQKLLFSDGETEITLNVPKDEEPSGRLMKIKSSGITFETKTGKARTDRAASFEFDRGDGKAVGADYDPQTHELHLRSQIELIWRGEDRTAIPMKVEAGEVTYKEQESKVYLNGWSRLTRDTMVLNAGPAIVTINKENGTIKEVNTEHAQGTDTRPDRKLEYSADVLTINFDENGTIQNIVGEKNAHLVSHAETTDTTINTDRIDMDFDTGSGDSVLKSALATGHSVTESKPVAKPETDPADTRILRSDVIRTMMKPDGKNIDTVDTPGAGALEFIPNAEGKPHRWMNGDQLYIKYALNNQIESLKSVNVNTRTLKPRQKDAKEDPPPALTWSKQMKAEFDPKTAQLSKLEQWDNFRYEEGTRKAKADRALLEQAQNVIHLSGTSRIWDPTGSTDADTIVMDEKNGDFSAEGKVNSTRMPDKKKDENGSSGLLSQDEPMHAKAKKMSSTDNNLQVRYEGNAIAWQGNDRLEADVIEIDRDNNIVKAHGHVVSQLLDKADDDTKDSKDKKKKGTAPVFTIVKAPDMVYKDDDKLATYTGGVVMDRPNMKVKSDELRAFLRDSDDDDSSSLDHAFADGKVQITETSLHRTRTGQSEHAEYYVDESKVILEKGQPQLADTIKGSTRGRKLTWFSDDDRLLVDGAEGDPAKSKLRRKHPSNTKT